MRRVAIALGLTLGLSCSSSGNLEGPARSGEALVQRVVVAHRATALRDASLQFFFRGVAYRMTRSGGEYRYERWPGPRQHEVLTNEGYQLLVDGEPAKLSKAMLAARARDLNSVVYFASLPYPLLDTAVHPRALGRDEVDGQSLDVLEVTFDEADGGEDHDDVFRYWLEPETGRMRYLAYSFARSGGGVRFRVATSTATAGEAILVNWTNYGVDDVDVPLDSLPDLWSQGRLPKLSTIELEQLRQIR